MSKQEDRAPAAPRPLRRDAELNRRRILQAGREVFATRGLQATLNDVAHHAGLGVGTVYRKFPDKQALAEAVFAEELDEIAGMARKSLDQGDGDGDAFAALAGFLEDALARAADNRGLREVMRSGGVGGDDLVRARREIEQHCRDLLAKARTQGTLREGITEADIGPIAAMIDAVMTLPGDQPPDQWRRYLSIILYGIHAG